MKNQLRIKRAFDIVFSLFGLIFFSPVIFISWAFASISTKSDGFYYQKRVGRNAKIFKLIKIKTMIDAPKSNSSITALNAHRITNYGVLFRKLKIDELPQLWNVLKGEMSFVGPRPDVPGYADKLVGQQRKILTFRPGITGPASIKYRDEESILSKVESPEKYNDEVIWPDKVKINMDYINNYSFFKDIKFIFKTLFKL